jgi:hypothetical protein
MAVAMATATTMQVSSMAKNSLDVMPGLMDISYQCNNSRLHYRMAGTFIIAPKPIFILSSQLPAKMRVSEKAAWKRLPETSRNPEAA